VLHFKRFYANMFGDYAVSMAENDKKLHAVEYYRSAGLELYVEMFFFSIEIPIILGVRGYYRFDQHDVYVRPYGFDFLFGVGTDAMSTFQRKNYL
jgi:hypothetical protein